VRRRRGVQACSCRARAAVSAVSGVGIVDKSFGAGVGRPGSLGVGFGLARESWRPEVNGELESRYRRFN
jgi:hypothetical protein